MNCLLLRVFVAFGLALGIGHSCRGVEVNARAAALASITTDQARAHVQVLADDTFEGREAGSRGNRAAGIYIVDLLKKWGLKPAGTAGTYYQSGNGSTNILAIVEGRDEKLRDEVILLGGHYDHVGYGTNRNSYGPTGFIHNGADDNASGVAALLEVAEALAQLPEKPARSILLAFWDGEEKGLLGSKYWARTSHGSAQSRAARDQRRHGRPTSEQFAGSDGHADRARLAADCQPSKRCARIESGLQLGFAGR